MKVAIRYVYADLLIEVLVETFRYSVTLEDTVPANKLIAASDYSRSDYSI